MVYSGLVLLCGFFLFAGGQSAPAAETADVVGTWEGQSVCTVPNSACHDEHVVYHIKSAGRDGRDLVISANKVVNGVEEFMGDVERQVHSDRLSCSAHTRRDDDWDFHVSGKHMSGTLVIGKEKTLYRKISVEKTPNT
jgi:hypothetical protein